MIMEKRVLQYMATRGSITSKEAIEYLGCTRLSEYIRRIKKHTDIESERITVENRWGERTSVSCYWIKKEMPTGGTDEGTQKRSIDIIPQERS